MMKHGNKALAREIISVVRTQNFQVKFFNFGPMIVLLTSVIFLMADIGDCKEETGGEIPQSPTGEER